MFSDIILIGRRTSPSKWQVIYILRFISMYVILKIITLMALERMNYCMFATRHVSSTSLNNFIFVNLYKILTTFKH
jgi:uncharacterized membrane protein (DUF373 family)